MKNADYGLQELFKESACVQPQNLGQKAVAIHLTEQGLQYCNQTHVCDAVKCVLELAILQLHREKRVEMTS